MACARWLRSDSIFKSSVSAGQHHGGHCPVGGLLKKCALSIGVILLEANDGLERACALALCLADLAVIVDDVPDNLSVLHDALDDSGYTVLVATHGEAALNRAAQVLPDIVLLDAIRFCAAALPRPRSIWNAST